MPVLALAVGAGAAGEPIGVLLALAEPLVFAALMVGVSLALLSSKPGLATSLVVSAVVGAISLHQPVTPSPSTSDAPAWLRTIKGCTLLSKPTLAPIRLFTWTVDDHQNIEEAIPAILKLKPDIIVLNGSDQLTMGSKLSEGLNGEVKFFPNQKREYGTTAVVRGNFQYCGGEKDAWHLPSSSSTQGTAILTFPHIDEIGVFPLVIPQFENKNDENSWLSWAQEVIHNANDTAKSLTAIGTRKIVLMGDLKVPARSTALVNPFRTVGLRSATSAPNWPTSILGLPFLSQHALDHAWVGRGWHIQSARVPNIGTQSRLPILFDLTPASIQSN